MQLGLKIQEISMKMNKISYQFDEFVMFIWYMCTDYRYNTNWSKHNTVANWLWLQVIFTINVDTFNENNYRW